MRTPASVAVSTGGVCLWVQGGVCLWVRGGLPVGAGGVSACGSGGVTPCGSGGVSASGSRGIYLWVSGVSVSGSGGVCLWACGMSTTPPGHIPPDTLSRRGVCLGWVREGCLPLGPGGVSTYGCLDTYPQTLGPGGGVSASGSGRGVCLWVRGVSASGSGMCLPQPLDTAPWTQTPFTTTPLSSLNRMTDGQV